MHLKNWITSAFTPVLAFVLVHGMAAAGADQSDHQHQFSASDPQLVEKAKGGHFTLQSLDGPISHADLHGKVTLLFFGFTSCVDVCPMTLWAVTRGFLELTEQELERVSALFVSVDPRIRHAGRAQEIHRTFSPEYRRRNELIGKPEKDRKKLWRGIS